MASLVPCTTLRVALTTRRLAHCLITFPNTSFGRPRFAVRTGLRNTQEGADVAGNPIDAYQDGLVEGAGADFLDQAGNQGEVSMRASHPPQPQPKGDCNGHPHPLAHHLDV